MANLMFSFEPFDCNGSQKAYFPLQEFKREEEGGELKQTHFLQMEDWCDFDDLSPKFNLYQENSSQKETLLWKDQLSFMEISESYEMQIDTVSRPIHPSKEHIKSNAREDCKQEEPPKKEKAFRTSLASLEFLRSFTSGYKRLSGENLNKSSEEAPQPTKEGRELSTADVMKVAAARYIKFSVETEGDLSMLKHPFGSMLSGLPFEETEDVELAHLLLTSAEKICNQQYDRARNLLKQCGHLASIAGNPTQRVVYYYADALQERINRETGQITSNGSFRKVGSRWGEDVEEIMTGPNQAILAGHQKAPLERIIQFMEMQAIIDSVASAKRIHLIDFRIRIGMHWSILMQALAVRFACPVELLKITAVGMLREKIEEMGQQLVSFAETLNLPFTFKAVIVSDMKELNEGLFEIGAEEVVGVYAHLFLKTMIVRPDCLENLLRVIRKLKPCIMTVTEIEGNHNSPSFINRFIESLFYFCAWFDFYDNCMDRNDCNRMYIEEKILSQGILSMVATEGDERLIRNVGIDVWRSFLARFGFIEIELNPLSLYQASLAVKQFSFGSSLNLDMNGKGLIVGWKGTPLYSLSSWKLR